MREDGVNNGEALRCDWLSFDALSPPLLYDLLRFRQAIFVVEQRCAYPDLDGLDCWAEHLLVWIDGELAGCLRLMPFPEEKRVAIGRVAVGEARRRKGLARLMMVHALARTAANYPDLRVTLAAQTYLVRFYENLGFRAVSPPFDDYGLTHVEMQLVPGDG